MKFILKLTFLFLFIFTQHLYTKSENLTDINTSAKTNMIIPALQTNNMHLHKPIQNISILEYQFQYFNQLLVAIGIVLTILLVGFTFINFRTIPNILKKEIEDKFEDKYKALNTQLSANNKYMIALNTADFYLTSIIPGKHYLALSHFFSALEIAISDQNNYKIITVLSQISISIDLSDNKELKAADYAKKMRLQNICDTFNYDKFKQIILDIPDMDKNIMQLKETVLNILNSANQSI